MSLLDVDFSEKVNKTAEESIQLLLSIKTIEDELICEWQKRLEKRTQVCDPLPIANVKVLTTLTTKKGKKYDFCVNKQITTVWHLFDNDIHRYVHNQFVSMLEYMRNQGNTIHSIILESIEDEHIRF